ncbi:MAG: hypothetical protein HY842_00930, partial [Bacteroidetes bacterium]|nr:hypothetical protein [Bacteroidota bacterium]
MSQTKTFLLTALGLCFFIAPATARYDPKLQKRPSAPQRVNFREACTTAQAQIDQDVNNVRARLLTGGDIWWDRSDGKYVVPKPLPGQPEVSAIFAAGIWLGGFDPGGNLKMACQTYGNNSGSSDYWPGPLRADDGSTSKYACDNWDRFFEVTGQEIREHLDRFRESRDGGEAYTADQVPAGVRGWPGRGNPYFYATHLFPLHDSDQGLAGFWDEDGDGRYDPLQGDFPIVDLQTCQDVPMFPDQMIFWIYNDEGGGAIHGETEGIPIRMEIQATAFAYATDNALNDMTFQQHKFINRAKEDIDSMYFALWMDADLGCYLDDYIGCDPSRNLAYYYNADDVDGQPGGTCGGVPTYGNTIPAIGIDIFRGPLDENHSELGMSSFMYYSNGDGPPGTTSPSTGKEFYRYMSGSWKDGTPLTYGGDGYFPGAPVNYTKYAFPGAPNDPDGWSMCHPGSEFPTGLPPYDRRTVQSSGPTRLQPGAVNELVFGVVYSPSLDYPCPDLSTLFFADDLAQCFFDDCFELANPIDAPDVDFIESDRELVGILTNKPPPASNNFEESFEEFIQCTFGDFDNTYNFEGYLVYQLANPNVSPFALNDPEKARLVFQSDVKNGVASVYNWKSKPNPNYDPTVPGSDDVLYYPELQVEGADEGVEHSFHLTTDAFVTGNNRLINHKKYYYMAKAYAYNQFQPFDPFTQTGQKTEYMESRNNIRLYTVVPRPAQSGLDKVQIVPNPFYNFKAYADDGGNGVLKITNLPARCEVSIYSLEGNLVRHCRLNEQTAP